MLLLPELVGLWSFKSEADRLFKLPTSEPTPLLPEPSLIKLSSSGEHELESSSRLEWLSKWCSLPELPEELFEPPELLPFDDLDFSCWRHLARRFLNQT